MPNHASTIKRLRRDKKKRLSNKSSIAFLRTLNKKLLKDPANEDAMKDFQKCFSQKAAKNIIHKRTAARKISRAMKLRNKTLATGS